MGPRGEGVSVLAGYWKAVASTCCTSISRPGGEATLERDSSRATSPVKHAPARDEERPRPGQRLVTGTSLSHHSPLPCPFFLCV